MQFAWIDKAGHETTRRTAEILQAGGLAAISRGLSAATPPVRESNIDLTPAGSQPDWLASRWDAMTRTTKPGVSLRSTPG